jgi:hypothetical protein
VGIPLKKCSGAIFKSFTKVKDVIFRGPYSVRKLKKKSKSAGALKIIFKAL